LLNRVSWGAVFSGVFIALVAQLLLNMLGIGIGLGTLEPLGSDNPSTRTFSIAAAAWWGISGIIAAFIGGYVAGRLCGRPKESTAGWHGVTTWAVTTLAVIYMLTTAAGSLVGGAFSAFNNAVGGLGRAATSMAQEAAPSIVGSDAFSQIEQQIRSAAGGTDAATLRDAAIAAARAALTGDPNQQQQAKQRAADALARAQSIPVEEAQRRIDQYQQQYQQAADQAKQQALAAADVTAKSISRGAIAGFIALVLGAIAGWFGGRLGTIEPTLTDLELMQTQRRS
jgi:hypothetical protein